MNRTFDYQRKFRLNRSPDRIIDLGNAGMFNEIPCVNCEPPEEISIIGCMFHSVHMIGSPNNKRIFTAYRSEEEPGVLLTVWQEIPFYLHIEEGGDVMLQILHNDKRVEHFIVDNSFVRSPWMAQQKTIDYLKNAWLPGLIELGLKGFCHIQSGKLLGKLSFDKFGDFIESTMSDIVKKLDKKPFRYFPIRTSETEAGGVIDVKLRDSAMAEALQILKSI